MKKMKKSSIYWIGIAPYALFYQPLQGLTSGLIFLIITVLYAIIIRLLADKFGE